MSKFSAEDILGTRSGQRPDISSRSEGPVNEIQALAPTISKFFLAFVAEMQRRLGVRDKDLNVTVQQKFVTVECLDDTPVEEVMRLSWSKRARTWSVVETMPAYLATLQILLALFVPSRKANSLIVSLGSGPGLYETFLAQLFSQYPLTSGVRFLCVDYADGMTKQHQQLIKNAQITVGRTRRKLTNIQAVTGRITFTFECLARGTGRTCPRSKKFKVQKISHFPNKYL